MARKKRIKWDVWLRSGYATTGPGRSTWFASQKLRSCWSYKAAHAAKVALILSGDYTDEQLEIKTRKYVPAGG